MDNDYSLQELIANMQQMVQSNSNKLNSAASTSGGPSWTYTTPNISDHVKSVYYPSDYYGKQWDDRYTYTGGTTSTTSVEEIRHMALVNRIDRLEKMLEERLCVLNPNPEMLQKWEILQEIYNQYKAAEALLFGHDADE
jgi:hypothetical protein